MTSAFLQGGLSLFHGTSLGLGVVLLVPGKELKSSQRFFSPALLAIPNKAADRRSLQVGSKKLIFQVPSPKMHASAMLVAGKGRFFFIFSRILFILGAA